MQVIDMIETVVERTALNKIREIVGKIYVLPYFTFNYGERYMLVIVW